MKHKKPKNITDYKKWLKEDQDVDISKRTSTYYDSVTNNIKRDFENSDFWKEINQNLEEFDQEYQVGTGYQLFIQKFEPEVYIKPFDSFLLKTYRKNILNNKNWPNEPYNGWLLPDNWYSNINDIIRTLFVVKYLDGVDFMITKTQSVCEQFHISPQMYYEARDEGYYAAHLYVKQNFEIPGVTWDTEQIDVSIEIQITTQLQEVIRKLLHKYYEDRRGDLNNESTKWKWDYKSDEFSANYLGHILHYVEGMIMEIRNKQEGEMK